MSPSPFPTFDRLSPILYLHNPPLPSKTSEPELIILATWMNAPPKLINLYATSYKRHFPHSRILLLTSSIPDLFLTSKTSYTALIRAANPVLSDLTGGRIVSATYSNGGGMALASLASLYATTTGKPLPLHGLVLDSTPGSGDDLDSGRRAMLTALPPFCRRGFMRHISHMLLTLLLVIAWTFIRRLGRTDPITAMRGALVNERIMAKGGKRAYIASKEDVMVSLDAVLEHAAESEAAGWEVRKEVLEGSGHVAHARADPERYWRVVRETLE